MLTPKNSGWIEVICGPMFSGKTEELIRRLVRAHGDEGMGIVKYINNAIRDRFQTFQKNLQPDTSMVRTEHGLFARLMSNVLKGRTGGDPVPPGPPNPASISIRRKRRDENLLIWTLKITDNEHTPDEEFLLQVNPSFAIAGDAKKIALKRREILVKHRNGNVLAEGTNPNFEIKFQKGSVCHVDLELSAPGERNYVVTCQCSAEIEVLEADNEETNGTGELEAVH